jgi:hypothetical protein
VRTRYPEWIGLGKQHRLGHVTAGPVDDALSMATLIRRDGSRHARAWSQQGLGGATAAIGRRGESRGDALGQKGRVGQRRRRGSLEGRAVWGRREFQVRSSQRGSKEESTLRRVTVSEAKGRGEGAIGRGRGRHVLAGGRLEVMRWQCRFMQARKRTYRLCSAAGDARRNCALGREVRRRSDVGGTGGGGSRDGAS